MWLEKRMEWFSAASGKRVRSSKFSEAPPPVLLDP